MLYIREQGFLKCDKLTRKTGYLTKLITCNDLHYVSLINGNDSRFQAVLQKTSHLSEIYYPQLLGRAVLLNMPRFFSAIFSAMKGLMPAKMQEKVLLFCLSAVTRIHFHD